MKAYKPLQEAFKNLGQSTIEWHKFSRFPKTAETANSVLHRDAVVDASTLAYLAHCLGLSNRQIVALLDDYAKEVPKKAAEVTILKKLIAPVDLDRTESELIIKLRAVSDKQRQSIMQMVESL
jgi:hypothetical protein